jgi:urease accessory protein
MSGDRLLRSDLRALESGALPHVDLRFASDGAGCTWLERQHAAYPFHVGRRLRVTGDPPGMATVYIQCCSGGIFEHDALHLNLEAGPGALAHVTTSASTVVHGMEQGEARQEVMVAAAAGAVLEYLPAPLILFPGARLRNRLRIRLDDGAAVLACDALLAHDPARGAAPDEPVRWFDRIHSDLSVESSDGRLLARDRYLLSGTVLARGLPGVTGPFRCHGTIVVLQNGLSTAPMENALRDEVHSVDAVYAGVSSLPNACGVLVRVLAPDAIALRSALRAVCNTARLLLLNVRSRSPGTNPPAAG